MHKLQCAWSNSSKHTEICMTPSRHGCQLLLKLRSAAPAVDSFACALSCNRPLSLSRHSVDSIVKPSPVSHAKVLPHNVSRGFAASADAAKEVNSGRDMQVRLVRVVAFGMILVAATKIVPTMFQSTVPHAVQLCGAKEPIMQKSAANRVSTLAESDASLKELVEAGVSQKLLGMLKPEVDPDVATAVLSALKEISRLPEGRAALKSARAPAILDKALQNHWLPTEHPSSQEAAKIKHWLTVH